MKNILAFGDSNTWGLIPGTKERYPGEIRWTGLVQNKLGDTKIIEEGLCGRTTVCEDEIRPFSKGVDTLPRIAALRRSKSTSLRRKYSSFRLFTLAMMSGSQAKILSLIQPL